MKALSSTFYLVEHSVVPQTVVRLCKLRLRCAHNSGFEPVMVLSFALRFPRRVTGSQLPEASFWIHRLKGMGNRSVWILQEVCGLSLSTRIFGVLNEDAHTPFEQLALAVRSTT